MILRVLGASLIVVTGFQAIEIAAVEPAPDGAVSIGSPIPNPSHGNTAQHQPDDKTKAEAAFDRGIDLMKLNRLNEAEAALREAIRLDATNRYFFMYLGDVLALQGRMPEAEEAYARGRLDDLVEGLEEMPTAGESDFHQANDLFATGRVAEAEDAYRSALRNAPNNAEYRFAFAAFLAIQNKWAQAEVEYRETVRLEPGNPESHYQLGVALVEQSKWLQAEAPLREAIRLNPKEGVFRLQLAETLQKLGREAEAQKEQRIALGLLDEKAIVQPEDWVKHKPPTDSDDNSNLVIFADPTDGGPAQESGAISADWFGATLLTISPDLASAFGRTQPGGAFVLNVLPESPAAKAGLLVDDVIVKLEGTIVSDARRLHSHRPGLESGNGITITVERSGELLVLRVLSEIPGGGESPKNTGWLPTHPHR